MLSIRNFYCSFMGLALLALSGCSEDPKATLERAKQLEANGDLVAATLELKSAIQQDPKNANLRLFLGELYLRQLAAPSAAKEISRALELGVSKRELATLKLAMAYYRSNNAKGLSEIPIEKDFELSTKASITAMQGHMAALQKDIPEARKHLATARDFEPDNAEAHFLAAQLALYEREFEKAFQEIEAVLAAHPDHLVALAFKSKIARRTGKRDIEIQSADKILALYPRNFEIRVRRSNALIAIGDKEAAIKDIDFLAKNFPRLPQTLVQQGLKELLIGEPATAYDFARDALSKSSDNPDALLLAGLSLKELDSLRQSADFLLRFLQVVPDSLYGRRLLAEIRLKQGDPKGALAILEPTIALGYQDAAIFNLAAVAKHSLGDKETASEWFSAATKLEPGNAQLAQTKALVALNTGDITRGLEGLEAALSTSEIISAADEIVVLTLLKRNEIERAGKILENLAAKAPESAVVLNLLGLLDIAKQDMEAAKTKFQKAKQLNPSLLSPYGNLAELFLREGDIAQAKTELSDFLTINEKVIPAYISLATIQSKFGEQQAALKTLEKAISIAPENLDVAIPLITQYFENDRAKDAEKVAFAAQMIYPNDERLIKLLAEAELQSGSKNKAVATIERLLGLQNRDANSYSEVAGFQFRAGAPEAAEQTLRAGLRNFPDNPALHVQLVSTFNKLRQFEKAQAHSAKMRSERPKDALGYLLEGELHELQGDIERAIKFYDEALRLNGRGAFAVKRYVAMAKADEESAMAWLEKWVVENPGAAAARARLADEYSRDNKFEAAIAHYERLLDEKTFKVNTLNSLAWAYYKIGDPRAQLVAEAAYLQGGFSPYIADTLGWILVEKGDVNGGLPYLEKAFTRAPKEAGIALHYGQALLRSGNQVAAKRALNQVLTTVAVDPELKRSAQKLLDDLD